MPRCIPHVLTICSNFKKNMVILKDERHPPSPSNSDEMDQDDVDEFSTNEMSPNADEPGQASGNSASNYHDDQIEEQAPPPLFIGNLSQNCTLQDLQHLFACMGNVAECKIVGDHAIVCMTTVSETNLSLRYLNNAELAGSRITVRMHNSTSDCLSTGRPNSIKDYEEAVLRSLNLTQNNLPSQRFQHTRNNGNSSAPNSPFTNQRTMHNQAHSHLPSQERIGISTTQWSGSVGVLSTVNSSGISMNSVMQPRNGLSHHSLQSFSGRQGSQYTLPTYINDVRCSTFVTSPLQQHTVSLKKPLFNYDGANVLRGSSNFMQNQHDVEFYPQPSAIAAARMFRSFKKPFTASASVTQCGGGLSDHGVSSLPENGTYRGTNNTSFPTYMNDVCRSTLTLQHGAAIGHTNHASRFQFASRLPPSGFDTIPPQNLTPYQPEKDNDVQGPNYQIL